MIESLPPELLLEIINYVHSKENSSNLCLVSRRFNDLASPLLLSRISLGAFTSRLRDKKTQLTALSKGGTKASALAKHLSINYSSIPDHDMLTVLSPLELIVLKYLKSAIDSFKTITTISWTTSSCDPVWLKSILNSIFAIPTLKGIHLWMSSTFAYNFVILELGKFLTQGSALTDLDISNDGYSSNSPLFQFINRTGKPLSLQRFRINNVSIPPRDFKPIVQNFRSLQSLYFYKNTDTSSLSGDSIWNTLVTERIYIRNLSTDVLNKSLLHYLSSFQGLQSFVLIVKCTRYTEGVQLVDILRAMIPHHTESLAELDILPDKDDHIGSPPFSENLVSLLSSFNNLRYFALHLCPTPNYSPLIKSSLSTCAKIFPKLERLVLHTPDMAFRIRNPRIPFPLPFSTSIHDAIAEYHCDDSFVPSFEIDCEKLVYKAHKDELAGTFSYIRVA